MIIDVEAFGHPARNNEDQLAVREGMYKALGWACAKVGIDRAHYAEEDRGDGILVLFSPMTPKILLVTRLMNRLADALHRHNVTHQAPARIRLRVALHAGEVHADSHGVAGAAINHAFRLIESSELRSALHDSNGSAALIVSAWFYDEVVRHHAEAEPARFHRIAVAVKETETTAWIRVMDSARISGKVEELTENRLYMYRIRDHPGRIGVMAGVIQRARDIDVWVNSENTDMEMSRPNEYTISAVIRYGGARRDSDGRIVQDIILDELEREVEGKRPVAASSAITTGSGELARTHHVHYVIHVAAVQGEPGLGFRQVRDVGRCVTNALEEADHLRADGRPVTTILFPILGTGQGHGGIEVTCRWLIGAAADYFAAHHETRITTVYFLAHTDAELAACQEVLTRSARFVPVAD